MCATFKRQQNLFSHKPNKRFFFLNLINANCNTLKLITFNTSDTNIYVVLFAEKTAVVDVLLAAVCFCFSRSSLAINGPDPSIKKIKEINIIILGSGNHLPNANIQNILCMYM